MYVLAPLFSLAGSGDYLVRGDSSYMLDKSPRWSSEQDHQSPSPHTLTNGLLPSSSSSTFSNKPGLVSAIQDVIWISNFALFLRSVSGVIDLC